MTDAYTWLDCDQRVWSRGCHSDKNIRIAKPSLDHQMLGRPWDICRLVLDQGISLRSKGSRILAMSSSQTKR